MCSPKFYNRDPIVTGYGGPPGPRGPPGPQGPPGPPWSGVITYQEPLFLSGSTLAIREASATTGGYVTTAPQQFAGDKQFVTSVSLATGPAVNAISADTGLIENSDSVIPTQAAVKSYVDAHSGGGTETLTTGNSKFVKDDARGTMKLSIYGNEIFKATDVDMTFGVPVTAEEVIFKSLFTSVIATASPTESNTLIFTVPKTVPYVIAKFSETGVTVPDTVTTGKVVIGSNGLVTSNSGPTSQMICPLMAGWSKEQVHFATSTGFSEVTYDKISFPDDESGPSPFSFLRGWHFNSALAMASELTLGGYVTLEETHLENTEFCFSFDFIIFNYPLDSEDLVEFTFSYCLHNPGSSTPLLSSYDNFVIDPVDVGANGMCRVVRPIPETVALPLERGTRSISVQLNRNITGNLSNVYLLGSSLHYNKLSITGVASP